MSKIDLSVVIITRNRLPKLKRCIDSVLKILPESEIIVVDNGSSDGTVEYLENHKNIKPVFLSVNKGVAGARNVGIKLCLRDFIMFLDDDAWIDDLDFSKIERYFQANPVVGLIAPKILYPDGRLQESIRSFPSIFALIWRGFLLYKLFPDFYWYRKYVLHNDKIIHEIDWAIGACQIMRKQIFGSVGLLDERYFFGYEDVDFCYKLKAKGYCNLYWPEAVIFHEYTRNSAKGISIHLFRHLLSIFRFFYKKKKL